MKTDRPTLKTKFEHKDPVPLYYQVELALRDQIQEGGLLPGQALPSENDLASQMGVSRITVRKALDRLEEDGFVIRRRGRTTTVNPHPPDLGEQGTGGGDFRGLEDELRQQGLNPHAKVLELIEGSAPEHIAEILGTSYDGEKIVRMRRVGDINGVPIWTESRYFPLEIGRSLDPELLSTESMIAVLSGLGKEIQDVEMHLEAVVANARQAKILKIRRGDPLLLHQSIAFGASREVLQITRVYLRADYYRLVLYARPSPGLTGLNITGGGYLVSGGSEQT